MVRGNWQQRVEKTEARRAAAKQRKQKKGNRGANKVLVQNLLAFLDKHDRDIQKYKDPTWTLSLWVDSIPSTFPPLMDFVEQEIRSPRGKKGRDRSASIEESSSTPNSTGKKKSRGRSGSFNDANKGGSKKLHPRSKEGQDNKPEEEESNVPRLCQKQFFKGKCEDQRSKRGCRHVHYPKSHCTLADSLLNDKNSGKGNEPSSNTLSVEALNLAEKAMVAATELADDADEGSIEMIYYIGRPMQSQPMSSEDDDDDEDNNDASMTISEHITKILTEESVPLSSIVYVAINNTLIFDRSQNGLLVSDQGIPNLLGLDKIRRSRAASIVSQTEDDIPRIEEMLTSSMLEFILTFLPDTAVATMTLTCCTWNNEIGRNSPELWRYLLNRRGWPVPSEEETDTSEGTRRVLRSAFIMHYSAARNLFAMKAGIDVLTREKSRSLNDDIVVHQFASRRSAPQMPNTCTEVKVWSPGQILAGYSSDCTLRLFKTIGKSDETSTVREIVCVCVDPHPKTKKKKCALIGMGLDQEVIGSLCSVVSDESVSYKFVVMTRENFLCAAGNNSNDYTGLNEMEDDALQVIDIGEAVVNYLLSSDEVDARQQRLVEFFQLGGEMHEVDVIVSSSVVACGYARFMFEVSIRVPDIFDEDDDDDADIEEHDRIQIDRKYVLLSATAEAIVWVGNGDMLPGGVNLYLMGRHFTDVDGRSHGATIVASSPFADGLHIIELEPRGGVLLSETLAASRDALSKLTCDDWQMAQVERQPIAICNEGQEVACGYALVKQVDDQRRSRSVIAFFPKEPACTSYDFVNIDDGWAVVGLSSYGEEFVIAFCAIQGVHDEDEEEIDADWLYGDTMPNSQRDPRVIARLIHVPTRKEIERVGIFRGPYHYRFISRYGMPFTMDILDGTGGVGLHCEGVAVMGDDIRDTVALAAETSSRSTTNSTKQKKKKKGRHKRETKKDAFARGMSMRG